MPLNERDRRRLDALSAIIKPANSLAARIDNLSDEHRNCYNEWRGRCAQWHAQWSARCDDDNERDAHPYARMLRGYGPPTLRKNISVALFGPKPMIPITSTDDDAARIFKEYCE